MLTATIGTALILSQAAVGGHGHHDARAGACDSCGARNGVVLATIAKLQTSPRWRERDDAANDLRDFDWHCHPEVVGALAYTLLNDPEEEVREEAAESLAKMAPCLPVAHAALSRAAECDRDHATRHWARKGLKALRGRCEGTCRVCGPADDGEFLTPGPIVDETIMPGLPVVPGKTLMGPQVDSGLETITPLPPLDRPGRISPNPLPPLDSPSETSPVPPLHPSDETLEPLPLEAPGPSAARSAVKPAEHVETKRVAQGRKRILPRFLRIPPSLLDR
jgi:hypothetical protein